jgi:hypothetical protein
MCEQGQRMSLCPEDAIKDIAVLETIKEGETVNRRD